MAHTKRRPCKTRKFGLIKNGMAIHAWKCLPCGIAGKWYKTEAAADRTMADHIESAGKS